MRLVIFVNGPARAGKDTAVEAMSNALHDGADYYASSISSIDCVRMMLEEADVDVSQKTDKDRDLLAVMGKALEDHSEFRSKSTGALIVSALKATEDHVVFVHVREKWMMERIEKSVWTPAKFCTLYIDRPGIAVSAQNASDQEALNPEGYDYYLLNNSTLSAFKTAAVEHLINILKAENA